MLQPSFCGHDQNRKVKSTRVSLTFVMGRLAGLSLMCDSCDLLAAEAVTDSTEQPVPVIVSCVDAFLGRCMSGYDTGTQNLLQLQLILNTDACASLKIRSSE